ncbi:origin recognition complex subunit 3 N-terminus-domain-containing protein [Gautieria morchelliformis]|nr:origin recognition complex subunit 3 N-terminus-domain-containing protein [Gautieria morchelliformis]
MEVDGSQMSYSANWDKEETALLPFVLPGKYMSLKIQSGSDDELYVDGPLVRSEFDLPHGPLLRFQAYRKAWDRCLGRVKKIIHSLQHHVVDHITSTIQHAYVVSSEDVVLPSSELVTVIVSSSDRTYVHECFARILETLSEEVNTTSHDESATDPIPVALVSRISETDCQSITSIIKALISGFITQPLGIHWQAKEVKSSLSLANYDMYILRAWYQAAQTLYVKGTSGADTPALVVMVQDLDLIDPINLRDLFELCRCHIPHVPISFLLGTSDSNYLHSVLPRSTLSCIKLERHNLPLDVKILETVVRETFFSLTFVPSVMIGPAGFEMVFAEFKRHNSTLDSLLSVLQLLHMQHFYNPLGFIGDAEHDSILNTALDNPSEAWKPFLQLLRRHDISMLLAAESAIDQMEWSKLTPRDVVENMREARVMFQNRMILVKVALHILETIIHFAREHGHKVMDAPLTSFETMGLECLRGSLGISIAQRVCNLMKQLKDIENQALLEELYRFVHNLPSSVRIAEGKLKQELVIVQHEVNWKTLDRFLDFLEKYFKETLRPFDDIAYMDVWWTGENGVPSSVGHWFLSFARALNESMTQPLNPNPHISIVTCLLDPHEYLGWNGSAGSTSELTSLPDVSILFRRYVESGKLINVYDWYESFSVALEDLGSNEDENDMEVDTMPTKRKTRGNGRADPRTSPPESGIKRVADGRKQEAQARFLRGASTINGDIAGTGVRVSFYVQNFLLVLLMKRSRGDTENALWTFVATSFGLIVAALTQLRGGNLSFIDGILVSQLVWFANLGTFLALASYSRSKGKKSVIRIAATFQGKFTTSIPP